MPKKLPPIHPGEQLREEFMILLGVSSNALARSLNMTPARINEIVRERRGISADTALRLARYFNTSHRFWLNLQMNYDVQCAEDAAGRAIARIQPLAASLGKFGDRPPLCFAIEEKLGYFPRDQVTVA